MKQILSFFVLIAFLFVGHLNAEISYHPSVYIDKGACPFECCVYRTWEVKKDTVLYAKPDKKSRIIGKCKRGSNVTAITGEVHTKAGKFKVKKKFETYKPGDIIWVYTYTGEGNFKVWKDGKFVDLNLGFSPYGGSNGSRCEVDKDCDGELEKRLDFTWWIKIKTPNGTIGWTFESSKFSGSDRCG